MFVATRKDKSVVLKVHAQPRSSRNSIAGLHDGAVKVCVTSPPADNKANKAIGNFLAQFFGLAKADVQLVSGNSSRRKSFVLTGIEEEEVRNRVLEKTQQEG